MQDDNQQDSIVQQDEPVDYGLENSPSPADIGLPENSRLEKSTALSSIDTNVKTQKQIDTVAIEEQRQHLLGQARSEIDAIKAQGLEAQDNEWLQENASLLESTYAALQLGEVFNKQAKAEPHNNKWHHAKTTMIGLGVIGASIVAEKYAPGYGKQFFAMVPGAYAGQDYERSKGKGLKGRAVGGFVGGVGMGVLADAAAETVPHVLPFVPKVAAKFVANMSDDVFLMRRQLRKGISYLGQATKDGIQKFKSPHRIEAKLVQKNVPQSLPKAA